MAISFFVWIKYMFSKRYVVTQVLQNVIVFGKRVVADITS